MLVSSFRLPSPLHFVARTHDEKPARRTKRLSGDAYYASPSRCGNPSSVVNTRERRAREADSPRWNNQRPSRGVEYPRGGVFPRRTQPLLAFSTRPFFFRASALLTLFTLTCRHERNEEQRRPGIMERPGRGVGEGRGGRECTRASARASEQRGNYGSASLMPRLRTALFLSGSHAVARTHAHIRALISPRAADRARLNAVMTRTRVHTSIRTYSRVHTMTEDTG